MQVEMNVQFANVLAQVPQGLELVEFLRHSISDILESSDSGPDLQLRLEHAVYPFVAHLGSLGVELHNPQGDPFDHKYDDHVIVVISPRRSIH